MKQSKRKVLVTGGAGFIASHVSEAYLAQGDDVWIVDNLSSGKTDECPGRGRVHRDGHSRPGDPKLVPGSSFRLG